MQLHAKTKFLEKVKKMKVGKGGDRMEEIQVAKG
jgi:hypothetical protein